MVIEYVDTVTVLESTKVPVPLQLDIMTLTVTIRGELVNYPDNNHYQNQRLGGQCLPLPYPESYWLSIATDSVTHYSLGAYNREDKLVGAIGVIRNVKDYFTAGSLHPEEQKLISNFRKVCMFLIAIDRRLNARPTSQTCYITTLMVAPEYRKIGIGTQLLQRASTVLLQEGSQYIYMYYTQIWPQFAFMRKWDMKELRKFKITIRSMAYKIPALSTVDVWLPQDVSSAWGAEAVRYHDQEPRTIRNLLNYYLLSIIHISEFTAVAFSLPVTFLHNCCLRRSTIFHPNLIRIAQVYLSGNYFAVVSRLVMHLYQVGVFHFDVYFKSHSSKILLFTASIIRSYFFLSSLIFMAEVIVERTFALYFVTDYEKKPRLWISTGIFSSR
ncbi:acetyltransferase, GNAT family [Ostertagia ostertagi]